jgi:hypothetical protein
VTVDTLNRSPQRTSPTRRRDERRAKRPTAGWASRPFRAPHAVMQAGRVERELLHPIGGLEGYSPAEVRAVQLHCS